ncbi:hypothetical protein EHQ42_09115 [Leptospira levettii]|uniref:hypothetical protein n=1 Tax=Leptospira levettii TaxID=2023178 RepID=UPI001083F420|nr:hypothetical protein [Leptospira levettii]TGL17660.1 hypothetical protein EHQ42_09115 [Leptospira levettii]
MNLSSIQLPNFSFRNLRKRFYIFVIPILLFQNCYLNPFVYDLLNPVEKEENPAALSLLGLGPTTFYVTGQLMVAGTGVSGATVRISGSTDPTNVSTTDSAGRFKLIGSIGTMTLEVDVSGTKFTIELSVTPLAVTLISISNSSFTVFNLGASPSSASDVTYLDITSSMPYEGLIVSNGNYMATVSSGFSFNFSETLESPSNPDTWRDENFIIFPSLTFLSTSVGGNNVIFQVNSGTYLPETDYYLTLQPGIKSVSGKSIKLTIIRFRIGALYL